MLNPRLTKFLIALSCVAALPGIAGAKEDPKRPLRVGMSADYYPMIYPGKDGKLEGADVEFVHALAKQMKLEIETSAVPFEKLLQSVATYKFDIGIAAMDMVPPEGNLEFVEYSSLPDALVVKDSSPLKPDPKLSLAKVKIGAVAVSAAREFFAKEAAAGRVEKARGFEGEAYLFDALERGYVDAVVLRLPAAIERVKKSGGKLRILADNVCRQPLGIAIPKTSTGLNKVIREAVEVLRKDGTTAKLEAKVEQQLKDQLKGLPAPK